MNRWFTALSWLLISACGSGLTRAEHSKVAPFLEALDSDGDGRVDAKEYDGVAYKAPSFEQADADSDGFLGPSELVGMLRGQDPMTFDRDEQQRMPLRERRGRGTKAPSGFGPGQQQLRDVFVFLDSELETAGWTEALPEPTEIKAAVSTGDLGSSACQGLLARYLDAYRGASLSFPVGLLNTAPPAAPVPAPGPAP